MVVLPADTLKNRTFWGLIVAQFLAGFNDQAIHASAMFFAIHQRILTEAQAISLMPILFYAPWAIFCTVAGFLADRYSKTTAIRLWKLSEVGIALVALSGFYLGAVHHSALGAWMVLSTVFMMGTHAAFFAPAKYGAMPEILQAHVLSRGNGILESTTFLAAILGTVAGGLLSFHFRQQEHWIGAILVGLSLAGVVFSYMVVHLPPANPSRLFPKNLFKPLWDNLKVLTHSRPLALSVLGIAFFIFMVSYMRATMYMHGQTRNPRWDEFKTSLVVATVALGVGLGSPLAGYLSGGKVELGLVPLGTLGMILATLAAAFTIEYTKALIGSLIVIGFFSGFYMVPLYTLLQHRAPKASKGDLIATSNFINVTGAIAASLLFYVLVQAGRLAGVTTVIPQEDNVAVGMLIEEPKFNKKGHLVRVVVQPADDEAKPITFQAKKIGKKGQEPLPWEEEPTEKQVIDFDDDLFEILGGGLAKGDHVIVSRYELATAQHSVVHYRVRQASQPLRDVYDNQGLPRYLFIGAALMTMGILALLLRKLPDFFLRMLFWIRSLGRYHLKGVGMHNLPTQGPVILATNCTHLVNGLQVLSVADRYTAFVLLEDSAQREYAPILRRVANRCGFLEFVAGATKAEDWHRARTLAEHALSHGHLVAVTLGGFASAEMERMIADLREQKAAALVPVFCGSVSPPSANGQPHSIQYVRVVFGEPIPKTASFDEVRNTIRHLGDWVTQTEQKGEIPVSIKIPKGPKPV